MSRKFFAILLILILTFALGSCGNSPNTSEDWSFDNYINAIDADYAKEIIEKISSFGDDPVMGMRSAGSPAETTAVNYMADEMRALGLQNVTIDETTTDGWTFKGANLTFTNADGKPQKIDLAAYQTTIKAVNEEIQLVYAGEGTEADYEGLDVTGKLVLIDVDQNENWWINYPAYQAKVKGARAIVAMSVYPEDGPDRVGVQDVCGPADAPALAISQQDEEALLAAITAAETSSITVTLNAYSEVFFDATSHNVWGEIPGKSDETIFVFAHMDGYFHSQYDDAQGVGVSMAIAKAIIDSGYEPEKTIRFCFHGAEEWGVSGSEYDWSTGAYEEIMTNHPEWIDGAFAIVNNDGGYAVLGETYMGTRSAVELVSFIEESIAPFLDDSKYEWTHKKTSTYTEDFQWAKMGIPAIVAGSGEGENYSNMGYHSNYDSWDAQPLDDEGFLEAIKIYGKFVIDLDQKLVRPMNFTARLEDFEESLNDTSEFDQLLSEGYTAAEALKAKMALVEESGDTAAAIEMNKNLYEVYKALQDALVGLDFDPEAITRHELYQNNVEMLEAGIGALKSGNIQEAYDEYLSSVDWAWYYMFFDIETCRYFEKQLFDNRDGTWGEGMIRYPHCDIGEVIKSLGAKYDNNNADVSGEITKLIQLKAIEEQRLKAVLAEEKSGLQHAVDLMKKYAH